MLQGRDEGLCNQVGSWFCEDTRDQQTLSQNKAVPQTKGRSEEMGGASPPSSRIRARRAGLHGARGVLQCRAEPALVVRSCQRGLSLLKAQPGGIIGNQIPCSLPVQPGAVDG